MILHCKPRYFWDESWKLFSKVLAKDLAALTSTRLNVTLRGISSSPPILLQTTSSPHITHSKERIIIAIMPENARPLSTPSGYQSTRDISIIRNTTRQRSQATFPKRNTIILRLTSALRDRSIVEGESLRSRIRAECRAVGQIAGIQNV